MISRFFIRRPRVALVSAIAVVLLGLIALSVLPVKEYPALTPPQIVVTARYPGADSETIAKSVAAPLEEAINGVDGMLYMVSSSTSAGVYTLNVYFEVGWDPNVAKMDVNNRVQLALPRLPEEVRRLGVEVRERSPDMLKVVAFYSEGGQRDVVELANFLLINVIDELKRIPGVGDAVLVDPKVYSIRVWLLPDKLSMYGLTPLEVYQAISRQNQQFTAGALADEPTTERPFFTYVLRGSDRFSSVKQFEEILVKVLPDGSALKLKDVARIELTSEQFNRNAFFKKQKVLPVPIFLTSRANALEVSKLVDEKLKELSKTWPPDIKYYFPYNPTVFVEESIKEVWITFGLAILFVVIVTYFFLGRLAPTIVPTLAIPVSILGAFIVMYVLGFSVNLLTLFGLILAIGLVVDDAIIVVENVERHMEEGLPVKEATLKAMEELTSPLIAIVLVLSAVFIPASLVGGFIGRFYQQFAVAIASSVLISGMTALVLSPVLCTLLLRERELHKRPIYPVYLFQLIFNRARESYIERVKLLLRRPVIFVLLFLLTLPLTYVLIKRLPTALVPTEDKGALFLIGNLPPGSSLKRTEEVLSKVEDILMKNPYIDRYVAISGFDFQGFTYSTDSLGGFIGLIDWSKRTKKEETSFALAQRINKELSQIREAMLFVVSPPAIMGFGRVGGFDLYLEDRTGGDIKQMFEVAQGFINKLRERKELTLVRTTFNPSNPYFEVIVDRTKAEAYGVPVDDVYKTLSMTLGASYVNDFNLFDRVYRVYLQAESDYRKAFDDLSKVYVKNRKGVPIPVANLVQIKPLSRPQLLERHNQFKSVRILGEPAPGYTSGDAIKVVEEVAKATLPPGYTIGWVGQSLQEVLSQQKGYVVLALAVLFVYLILVALYESWLAPIAVILSIPFALLGASLTLNLLKLPNDVYFQVGLVSLVGLSAKNAILVVEFAEERIRRGLDIISAILEASYLRFRPIVMTSFAFIAGAIPLALSTGAGAMSRHVIGWTVVGGMLFATLFGTLFIPLLYYVIKALSLKILKRGKENA
jgi:multidrug efflux pump